MKIWLVLADSRACRRLNADLRGLKSPRCDRSRYLREQAEMERIREPRVVSLTHIPFEGDLVGSNLEEVGGPFVWAEAGVVADSQIGDNSPVAEPLPFPMVRHRPIPGAPVGMRTTNWGRFVSYGRAA